MPKISVITPCLNAEAYLPQAIQSVLEQDYPNTEHIVVDGASSDGTLDILRAHPQLQWVSEPDSGQSNAMNKGFAMSSGDLVVYLNADDYFLPGAFHAVAERYRAGDRFIVGDVLVIEQDGRSKRVRPRTQHLAMLNHWEKWTQQGEVYLSPFPNNPVQYFYARDIQQRCPFNEQNHNTMDLEFLLRASRLTELKHIDTVLGAYRLLDQAKNIKAQEDAINYWTAANFPYIDEIIADWAPAEIIAYKNRQARGYQIEGSQRAFRRVEQSLDELLHTSMARQPSPKYRSYKQLLSELIGYADRLAGMKPAP